MVSTVTSPDTLYRGVTKPPIHGWALTHLMARHTFTGASEAELKAEYRDLLQRAYDDFVTSDAATETGFRCYICGEPSTEICSRCTRDACGNHICERCGLCSDCCTCDDRPR